MCSAVSINLYSFVHYECEYIFIYMSRFFGILCAVAKPKFGWLYGSFSENKLVNKNKKGCDVELIRQQN